MFFVSGRGLFRFSLKHTSDKWGLGAPLHIKMSTKIQIAQGNIPQDRVFLQTSTLQSM